MINFYYRKEIYYATNKNKRNKWKSNMWNKWKVIDELIDAVKCPRDYFEIECIKSVAIRDGKIADVYPFVEVAWFDRGQEVQDTVAKIITDNIEKI